MNRHFIILFISLFIASCNLMQGIKDTGDAVQDGAKSAAEAAKDIPDALGKASNKIESDIKGE